MRQQEYNDFYLLVREIINDEDPIRLLEMGYPEDEYDPEISSLLPKIDSCKSLEELQNMIHSEFVSMFDDSIAGDIEHYKNVAERIWNLKVTH